MVIRAERRANGSIWLVSDTPLSYEEMVEARDAYIRNTTLKSALHELEYLDFTRMRNHGEESLIHAKRRVWEMEKIAENSDDPEIKESFNNLAFYERRRVEKEYNW